MARRPFGGSVSDFVTDSHGNVRASAAVTFWTAATGGSQVTDIQTATGGATSPAGTITAAADGAVSFLGPADGTAALYADAGGSRRVLMLATDTATRLAAAEAALAAASGTYLAHAGAGNGSDDTTSLQALLTAARTAGGGIVKGKPGETYKLSGPLVIGSGTTLDMTGATITLNSGSNSNMLNNYAVTSGVRDSNITVIGGTWDRPVVNGGANVLGHNHRFRKVDGLRVLHVNYTAVGSPTGGKFACNIGDATKVEVTDIDLNVQSDGVHLTGPVSGAVIDGVRGACGDDAVALTPWDYTGWDDVKGDITDVVIRNVNTSHPGGVPVKVLGGNTYNCKRILIDGVSGEQQVTTNALVFIGDDNATSNTQGGWLDAITVRNVTGKIDLASPKVKITATNAGNILVDGVSTDEAVQVTGLVRVAPTSAGTIASLTVRNITSAGNQSAGSYLVYIGGCTVTNLMIDGVLGSWVGDICWVDNAATVTRARVVGVVGAGTGGSLMHSSSGTTVTALELLGCNVTGMAWLGDLSTTTEVHVVSVTANLTNGVVNAAGTVTLITGPHVKLSGTIAPTISGSLTRTRAKTATVTTAETTSSTSYTDLATAGPAVTLDVPESGAVDVTIVSELYNSGGGYAYANFAMSGANTTSNQAEWRIYSPSIDYTGSKTIRLTGLTPGSTTFTMKYQIAGSGPGRFTNRMIHVAPVY